MNWLSTADMDLSWCGANCQVAPDDCDTLPYLGVCTVDVFHQSNTGDQRRRVVTGLLRVHRDGQGDVLHLLNLNGGVLLTINGGLEGHQLLIDAILATESLVKKGEVVQDDVGLTFQTYELPL